MTDLDTLLPQGYRTWRWADLTDEEKQDARDAFEITVRGPWDDEPDKVQWVDPATDLDCLIVRNRMGSLCGYVGVPENHPAYGKPYDNLDVSVHGDLTFANTCSPGEPIQGICHIAEPGRTEKPYWFGFDCGHSFDYQPGLASMDKMLPEHLRTPTYVHDEVMSSSSWHLERYRDVAYVVDEVRSLAAQLADLA